MLNRLKRQSAHQYLSRLRHRIRSYLSLRDIKNDSHSKTQSTLSSRLWSSVAMDHFTCFSRGTAELPWLEIHGSPMIVYFIERNTHVIIECKLCFGISSDAFDPEFSVPMNVSDILILLSFQVRVSCSRKVDTADPTAVVLQLVTTLAHMSCKLFPQTETRELAFHPGRFFRAVRRSSPAPTPASGSGCHAHTLCPPFR